MAFPPGSRGLGALLVGGAVIVASALGVAPEFRSEVVGVTGDGGQSAAGGLEPEQLEGLEPEELEALGLDPDAAGTPGGTATPGEGGTRAGRGGTGAGQGSSGDGDGDGDGDGGGGLACAPGRNGGETDTGVFVNEIRLASTTAESGPGASFLGEARHGMVAVINEVNRAGGICGRQLSLTARDDGWDAQRGRTFLNSFINDKKGYFALAVVPSSEGLNAAVRAGDIAKAKIPVVGTDGMLFSQYDEPWVWPVAASTISTAHIAAREMYQAGVRTFGLVYDNRYKFGVEGAAAFKAAVSRLKGATLKASVPVEAGRQDYSSETARFTRDCNPCQGTFLLLEPTTAVSWIGSDSSSGSYWRGSKRTDGAQPLFTSGFAQSCGSRCHGMYVWTGYTPPYAPFAKERAVRDYANSIRRVSATADTANQFTEGAYVGMRLLVEAMKKVGPNLTRERLKAALDSMSYDSGLTRKLAWRPGNHFANTAMLGFTIQYSGGFNGFQYQNTGWVADPWWNRDHP